MVLRLAAVACRYIHYYRTHFLPQGYLPLQWSPSIVDTLGNEHLVPYSEVSLTQELQVNSGKAFIVSYPDPSPKRKEGLSLVPRPPPFSFFSLRSV